MIRPCRLNNPTKFSRLVVSYPRRTNKKVSFLHGHPPILHHVSRNKIGKVTRAQVRKIAEIKMPDLNCDTIESAMAMIAGAARSMGMEVVD